jgi:hypothetical protein
VSEAWFSALGVPLGEDERNDAAAYLAALGMRVPVHAVTSWTEAGELCRRRSDEWWAAEEAERARLEQGAHLEPADPEWLALNETLHGAAASAAARAGCADAALIYAAAGAASYALYHARLAHAAGAPSAHPFRRKYALYCAGHWPLGVYDSQFRIF